VGARQYDRPLNTPLNYHVISPLFLLNYHILTECFTKQRNCVSDVIGANDDLQVIRGAGSKLNVEGTISGARKLFSLCLQFSAVPLHCGLHCELELQQLVDRVHVTSSRFGLVISASKTEAQCIERDSQMLNIKLGASSLKETEHFVYLGGTVSADLSCDRH